MFKGMPPIFWVGCIILYGLTALFMIIEMTVPGFVYGAKIGGAPAQFFYANFFMLLVVNMFIAFLWFYVPEQADKKKVTTSQGVTKDATS